MRAAAGVGVAAGLAFAAAGCGDSYEAVLDSQPIVLQRAPLGAPASSGIVGDGAYRRFERFRIPAIHRVKRGVKPGQQPPRIIH